MRVIFPGFLYEDELDLAGIDPLYVRRVDSCKSFVIKAKKSSQSYLFAQCRGA